MLNLPQFGELDENYPPWEYQNLNFPQIENGYASKMNTMLKVHDKYSHIPQSIHITNTDTRLKNLPFFPSIQVSKTTLFLRKDSSANEICVKHVWLCHTTVP